MQAIREAQPPFGWLCIECETDNRITAKQTAEPGSFYCKDHIAARRKLADRTARLNAAYTGTYKAGE